MGWTSGQRRRALHSARRVHLLFCGTDHLARLSGVVRGYAARSSMYRGSGHWQRGRVSCADPDKRPDRRGDEPHPLTGKKAGQCGPDDELGPKVREAVFRGALEFCPFANCPQPRGFREEASVASAQPGLRPKIEQGCPFRPGRAQEGWWSGGCNLETLRDGPRCLVRGGGEPVKILTVSERAMLGRRASPMKRGGPSGSGSMRWALADGPSSWLLATTLAVVGLPFF